VPAARSPRRPPLRTAGGLLLTSVSVIVGIAAVVVMREGGLVGGLIFGAAAVLIQLGVRRGRQLRARSAEAVVADDARTPVLYLRPFEADNTLLRSNPGLPFLTSSYEQDLTRQLRARIGPVIAIGNPAEKLPELGAARTYVRDGDWQATANDLMLQAGLIVLHVGSSPGLQWEVARIVELGLPEKLVVAVPNTPDRPRLYAGFRVATSRVFPKALPEVGAGDLICFRADWTPQLLRIGTPYPGISELQRRALTSLQKARR
jgi:hypothetical protein